MQGHNEAPESAPADAWLDFERKWVAAYADFELAVRFMRTPADRELIAFMCMGFELEQAAFGIREPQVAMTKLQWWGEELSGAVAARHPLTQMLAANEPFRGVESAAWNRVIAGALVQREIEPASKLEDLLAHYARLHAPLAAIESRLRAGIDADATARVLDLSRAARAVGALPALLEAGQLPLPLDVLARHQLTRADLGTASPSRDAAVRDQFAVLAGELDAVLRSGARLSLPRKALALLLRWQCARTARASDPLAAWQALQGRLPLSVTWSTWRAARHS